jgi:hypothetical protein
MAVRHRLAVRDVAHRQLDNLPRPCPQDISQDVNLFDFRVLNR